MDRKNPAGSIGVRELQVFQLRISHGGSMQLECGSPEGRYNQEFLERRTSYMSISLGNCTIYNHYALLFIPPGLL